MTGPGSLKVVGEKMILPKGTSFAKILVLLFGEIIFSATTLKLPGPVTINLLLPYILQRYVKLACLSLPRTP